MNKRRAYVYSGAHHFVSTFYGAWMSAKMKVSHPQQLKKSKSWGPFWSYQLNSSANSAHLVHVRGKQAGLEVLSSWQLQSGPQNFDSFSIAMGANYSFEVKNFEIRVPAFFKHNSSIMTTVGVWSSGLKMKQKHQISCSKVHCTKFKVSNIFIS